MVKERRQIVFENQDLIDALLAFDREHAKKFAPRRKVTCVVSKDEPVRAKLTLVGPSNDQEETFEIDTNNLAAALLWYCMKLGVPMPKRARKELRVLGDSVTLNFTLSHNTRELNLRLSA